MKIELYALLVAIIIVLAIALPLYFLASKDKPTQAAEQTLAVAVPSRFTSEDVNMNNNCYSFLIKDHKTGREWLALYKTGVIEVTPPIEKEKP